MRGRLLRRNTLRCASIVDAGDRSHAGETFQCVGWLVSELTHWPPPDIHRSADAMPESVPTRFRDSPNGCARPRWGERTREPWEFGVAARDYARPTKVANDSGSPCRVDSRKLDLHSGHAAFGAKRRELNNKSMTRLSGILRRTSFRLTPTAALTKANCAAW